MLWSCLTSLIVNLTLQGGGRSNLVKVRGWLWISDFRGFWACGSLQYRAARCSTFLLMDCWEVAAIATRAP